MNQSVDPFMLKQWYSSVEAHTAKTVFLPLSKEEAAAMKRGCEARRKKAVLNEEETRLLEELERKMAQFASEERPAFVKLSARSCKDSILRSSHFKNVLKTEVALLPAQHANDLLRAYVRAQCFALKRTGVDALNDMLESRRIYEDLTLALLEKVFAKYIDLLCSHFLFFRISD